MYNDVFLDSYTDTLRQVLPDLDTTSFRMLFRTPEWDALELKQRLRFLEEATDQVLPSDFKKKIKALGQIIDIARKKGAGDQNFLYIFLADIITRHGLEHPEFSFPAIEMMTAFTSFEFAGRPFFIKHPDKMMAQMLVWAQHPNPNVRRYASEGCRPRLPWGQQLKMFVDDPTPIIPVLEILKDDPSEYVRKSVANNLNDISKDHPQLVLSLIENWLTHASDRTTKLLRQAARTLLKKGNTKALSLFGNHDHVTFEASDITIQPSSLHIGEDLIFEANLSSTHPEDALFRLEYFIYYVKSNGLLSKKIFKISDTQLAPGQSRTIFKKHRFADLTTRKHFPGFHKISLVVNGKEGKTTDFKLKLSPDE